jgi:hypothetical protein
MTHESGLITVKEVRRRFRKYTRIESDKQMQRIRNDPARGFPKSKSPPGSWPTYDEIEVEAWFLANKQR